MIFVYAKCLNILSCSYHPCLVACSGVQYMLSCVFVLFFFVLYLFSTRAFHLEYFSCTGIVAISFIGVENYRPVASHWQNWPHNVASSTPRHERDSNSQLYWWYTLIAQVDVNPATMRSRPRRPLHMWVRYRPANISQRCCKESSFKSLNINYKPPEWKIVLKSICKHWIPDWHSRMISHLNYCSYWLLLSIQRCMTAIFRKE
jgi:hypothetical protein